MCLFSQLWIPTFAFPRWLDSIAPSCSQPSLRSTSYTECERKHTSMPVFCLGFLAPLTI
jgi:hypothetical protein